MRTYTLFVEDGRYSVQTLLAIEAQDDEAALEAARRQLRQSAYYNCVEVWEDERLVGNIESGQSVLPNRL